MGRHVERSTGSRIADRSYRPSRHGPLDATAPPELAPAKAPEPPSSIPENLHGFWRAVVAELTERGSLVKADLVTLEAAFAQLGIANRIRAWLEGALEQQAINPGHVAKLQSAFNSASSAAARVFARFGVASPLDRARVKAAAPGKRQSSLDELLDAEKPKPSVREVLSRKKKEAPKK